jgi:uncharacterized protein (TIGR02246 family)
MRRTVRLVVTGGAALALAVGAGACGANSGDGDGGGGAGAPSGLTPRAAQRVAATEPQSSSRQLMPPTKDFIAHLFTQWNVALATGDPQQVANRYAPDAVLLPTLSNTVRTDRPGLVAYFTEFLKSRPQGAIKQSVITVLDPTTAIDTGVYVFLLHDQAVERQVEARYTFVYERRGDQWLIVNHHSSVLPEPAAH